MSCWKALGLSLIPISFRTTAIIGTQAVVVGFCLGIFAKLVFAVGFLVESHERGRVEGKSFCEVAQGLGRLFKHLIYFSTEKMALEKHIGIAFGRMENGVVNIRKRSQILVEFVVFVGTPEVYLVVVWIGL